MSIHNVGSQGVSSRRTSVSKNVEQRASSIGSVAGFDSRNHAEEQKAVPSQQVSQHEFAVPQNSNTPPALSQNSNTELLGSAKNDPSASSSTQSKSDFAEALKGWAQIAAKAQEEGSSGHVRKAPGVSTIQPCANEQPGSGSLGRTAGVTKPHENRRSDGGPMSWQITGAPQVIPTKSVSDTTGHLDTSSGSEKSAIGLGSGQTGNKRPGITAMQTNDKGDGVHVATQKSKLQEKHHPEGAAQAYHIRDAAVRPSAVLAAQDSTRQVVDL